MAFIKCKQNCFQMSTSTFLIPLHSPTANSAHSTNSLSIRYLFKYKPQPDRDAHFRRSCSTPTAAVAESQSVKSWKGKIYRHVYGRKRYTLLEIFAAHNHIPPYSTKIKTFDVAKHILISNHDVSANVDDRIVRDWYEWLQCTSTSKTAKNLWLIGWREMMVSEEILNLFCKARGDSRVLKNKSCFVAQKKKKPEHETDANMAATTI